ncbi:uncharacterized protein [Phyllobates terribilis]|uniref:uncharacterized protein n=1 Tax=Phyllobates terribilis TaxID=111132 RepID=UPI003CCB3719
MRSYSFREKEYDLIFIYTSFTSVGPRLVKTSINRLVIEYDFQCREVKVSNVTLSHVNHEAVNEFKLIKTINKEYGEYGGYTVQNEKGGACRTEREDYRALGKHVEVCHRLSNLLSIHVRNPQIESPSGQISLEFVLEDRTKQLNARSKYAEICGKRIKEIDSLQLVHETRNLYKCQLLVKVVVIANPCGLVVLTFGVARLLRDKVTNELVAVKYIERGDKIDENVQREIINHRSLRHPNIVRFREVILTPTHLAIVMEYASGGELFDRICNAGRFNEDEARFFVQQLISDVSYCHAMQVCHRDMKLENTLLDGSPAPHLKICEFGYSKSSLYHSQPKSTVGTPAYIAPEVLLKKEYDGKIADVWSCGVTLYVMLMGGYPFEDPDEPKDFRKMIQRILTVQYSIPDNIIISLECRHLLSRIFVGDPTLEKVVETVVAAT